MEKVCFWLWLRCMLFLFCFVFIVIFASVFLEKTEGGVSFSYGNLETHHVRSIIKETINKVVGHLLGLLKGTYCLSLTFPFYTCTGGHQGGNQLE